MIKAVLFDVDGVLLDSFEAGLKFFQNIMIYLGRPEPTRADFKNAFHLPFVHALKFLAKAELTEELERMHEIVTKVDYPAELLKEPAGLYETLHALQKDYQLGIVTCRNKEGLSRRYFSHFDTQKYFTVCITVEDVTHPKPHPEPLLLGAERLGVRPEECVYIGDSHTDVEAGKAAGMKTVLYGGKRHKDASAATQTFVTLPEVILAL